MYLIFSEILSNFIEKNMRFWVNFSDSEILWAQPVFQEMLKRKLVNNLPLMFEKCTKNHTFRPRGSIAEILHIRCTWCAQTYNIINSISRSSLLFLLGKMINKPWKMPQHDSQNPEILYQKCACQHLRKLCQKPAHSFLLNKLPAKSIIW